MPMSDGRAPGRSWGRYLREIANRPGWSVARLAREAKLNRTTIFDWIRDGDADRVTIGSVLAVAAAVGDRPLDALRAAAGIAEVDDELERILLADIPQDAKRELLDLLERDRLEDQRRRASRVDQMIRFYGTAS